MRDYTRRRADHSTRAQTTDVVTDHQIRPNPLIFAKNSGALRAPTNPQTTDLVTDRPSAEAQTTDLVTHGPALAICYLQASLFYFRPADHDFLDPRV